MKKNVMLSVKTGSLFLLTCFCLFVSTLQVDAKNNLQISDLGPITSIKASGPMTIYVDYNSKQSLKITGNQELKDLLTYRQVGETMEFTLKTTRGATQNSELSIYLTTELLSSISLSGSAQCIVTPVMPLKDIFNIRLSGASKLQMDSCVSNEIFIETSAASKFSGHIHGKVVSIANSGASNIQGSIEAHNIFASLSSASSMEISGSTESLDIKSSSASKFKGDSFNTNKLKVILSSASSVKCQVKQSIEGAISGASTLNYSGNPSLIGFESSGASKVKKY